MNRYKTMDEYWLSTLESVSKLGSMIKSRVGSCYELLGSSALLLDPSQSWLQNPHRRLSRRYASAELLWYLSGLDSAAAIQAYAPQYKDFLDDGVTAYGAYGSRIKNEDQIRLVYEMLRDHNNTRQAVIRFWQHGDLTKAHAKESKDIPCTMSMQFLLRSGRLHLIVTMRSNDIWLGMPYDVWCFTQIQQLIASMLDVKLGSYVHQVGSIHLYEKDMLKLVDRARLNGSEMFDSSLKREHETRANFPKSWNDFEKQVDIAVDLEECYRIGESNDLNVIDKKLGFHTFFGRCVRECATAWVS